MKFEWLMVAFIALCGISSAQTKNSHEDEITRLVEKYDDAWNHKDAAMVDRLLAPDYVYFSSKGQVRSRQSLFDEFLSPKYTLVSAIRSEVKVYRSSDTAVVSSRWKGNGTYDGKEFHDDQRCSIVLSREKPGWMILSEHCTQIVAP
jgi:ketosteroid isomerase-like protein